MGDAGHTEDDDGGGEESMEIDEPDAGGSGSVFLSVDSQPEAAVRSILKGS
jgi:hypothetical protein